MVDGIPIRDFVNHEANGVAFPKNQPMRIYSSLWNADDWATRGGLIKTDWTQAPFVASYRNFNADACVWSSGKSSCSNSKSSNMPWFNQQLDSSSQKRLKWVQKNYMIYNYCTDVKRFPQGLPTECSLPWFLHYICMCIWWYYLLFFFLLMYLCVCELILLLMIDEFIE